MRRVLFIFFSVFLNVSLYADNAKDSLVFYLGQKKYFEESNIMNEDYLDALYSIMQFSNGCKEYQRTINVAPIYLEKVHTVLGNTIVNLLLLYGNLAYAVEYEENSSLYTLKTKTEGKVKDLLKGKENDVKKVSSQYFSFLLKRIGVADVKKGTHMQSVGAGYRDTDSLFLENDCL
jgi:hypothetical protein